MLLALISCLNRLIDWQFWEICSNQSSQISTAREVRGKNERNFRFLTKEIEMNWIELKLQNSPNPVISHISYFVRSMTFKCLLSGMSFSLSRIEVFTQEIATCWESIFGQRCLHFFHWLLFHSFKRVQTPDFCCKKSDVNAKDKQMKIEAKKSFSGHWHGRTSKDLVKWTNLQVRLLRSSSPFLFCALISY